MVKHTPFLGLSGRMIEEHRVDENRKKSTRNERCFPLFVVERAEEPDGTTDKHNPVEYIQKGLQSRFTPFTVQLLEKLYHNQEKRGNLCKNDDF